MRNGFEDLDLGRLRRRRSEKWQAHPPDVLPASCPYGAWLLGVLASEAAWNSGGERLDRMAAAAG